MIFLAASTDDASKWMSSSFTEFVTVWRVPIVIVVTVLVAIVVRLILRRTIKQVVDRIVNGVKKRQGAADTQALIASPVQTARVVQRTRTLGSVLENLATVAVVIIALAVIIPQVLPNAAVGIVGGASLVAAGLAVGAQSIVKDLLSGIFMILEDQAGVGDVVDTGQATGVVENVGLRVMQIRDVNGILWFVPNGQILRVGNLSQGWSRVLVDITVPYDTDIDAVQDALLKAAVTMSQESRWRQRIVEKPEIWGLQSITDAGMVFRLVVKTRASELDVVGRELRTRLKHAVDELGITLPAMAMIMPEGWENATSINGLRTVRTQPTPAPTKPRRPKRNILGQPIRTDDPDSGKDPR
ncbi:MULTISPECIES: mechanosensitive ion channel family protein [Curtobacterium]|jgi:small conductance mechanosensitive channel|uniref:mechanosensitive ion channel family protein n=1 Tax=Curtobacterium TaxID=2034 RepID=UPI000DA83AE9|nr:MULTISPECIES: mechanosensitive ion channel domain-containing protein [Curtobacterium]MBF4592717.1 mechanosensitive ion channel [Curtobacterium flaccumfaciens]MBF4628525.1 mechanosensitive ion channel [Curtobacterium flaccumfaciens]PZE54248.1 mechanosensitive ion channel protein MscS [Curtobacterium sp. MCLR17_044]PZF39280.1 mechanosensitive ion channel protein MscS [Curtobacterium sp. MCLR17_053]PZF49895.1 mechanosensitive ion channel protein MscS [Curtobacterium sp. MCLR17_051]